MAQLKNLAGMVFGRLTVLEHRGKNDKGSHTWLCRCECGKTAVVRGDALRYGITRSCGCLAHEAHVAAGKRPKGPSPRLIDLTGQRFDFLTVIGRGENNRHGQARWRCRCVCGRETLVATGKLKSGRTISCGCMGLLHATQAKIRHGDAISANTARLYKVWNAMKRRCGNPNCVQYKYYGGKGVEVCGEWREYERFKAWALEHGYADGLTIDRIDPDGNYEPGNCQWIPMAENISRAKRLPLDVREKVAQMLRRGVSGVEIVRELHVSRPAISRIKAELGLAKPRQTK